MASFHAVPEIFEKDIQRALISNGLKIRKNYPTSFFFAVKTL